MGVLADKVTFVAAIFESPSRMWRKFDGGANVLLINVIPHDGIGCCRLRYRLQGVRYVGYGLSVFIPLQHFFQLRSRVLILHLIDSQPRPDFGNPETVERRDDEGVDILVQDCDQHSLLCSAMPLRIPPIQRVIVQTVAVSLEEFVA